MVATPEGKYERAMPDSAGGHDNYILKSASRLSETSNIISIIKRMGLNPKFKCCTKDVRSHYNLMVGKVLNIQGVHCI